MKTKKKEKKWRENGTEKNREKKMDKNKTINECVDGKCKNDKCNYMCNGHNKGNFVLSNQSKEKKKLIFFS